MNSVSKDIYCTFMSKVVYVTRPLIIFTVAVTENLHDSQPYYAMLAYIVLSLVPELCHDQN